MSESKQAPELLVTGRIDRQGYQFQVQIPEQVYVWFANLKSYLKDNGWSIPHDRTAIIRTEVAKTGKTFHHQIWLSAAYILGEASSYGERDPRVFKADLTIDYNCLEVRWEYTFRWEYPLQDRMDKLLAAWQDIKAEAADGEQYSGVLLNGGLDRQTPVTTEAMVDIVENKLPRVKALWSELDSILKPKE